MDFLYITYKMIGEKKALPFLMYFVLILYLLINTPLVSDEFAWIILANSYDFKELLLPKDWFLIAPVEHYLLFMWYRFFDIYNLFIVNMLKVIYIFLSFYLIAKFFTIFLDRQNAFLASFLFIFFPSHDTTVFCLEGIYSTLTIAFYLYSFYLAHNNKLILSFITAIIASFTSYASVPIALFLFSLFVLNKKLKNGVIIIIPSIIYSLYYIFMSRIMHLMPSQIPDTISIYNITKQFILQIVTFIDSIFGPSMWVKIYYSFFQLSLSSIIIGIILIIVFYKTYQKNNTIYDRKLIISLIVLMLFSFMLFAITGMYPQLAFNLGNRTTIFGSLLLAYLIVLMPISHKVRTLNFALIIFTILGISDHWKSWNIHQQKVIANIKNNQYLKIYQDSKAIYVSGNQYSKYGEIGHIEFFSENWVVNSVFKLALNKPIAAMSINKRHKYIDGYLVDTKYNSKTKVNDYINIYDSEKNIFFELNHDEINDYIKSLPSDKRHWIQILNIKFIKDLVTMLMPRLKYAL